MASLTFLTGYLQSEFSAIDEISDEWVTSSVDGNFMDFGNISSVLKPSFFKSDDITLRLTTLSTKLNEYELHCDDPKLWKYLLDLKLPGNKLIVLLWFSIEWGLTKNSSTEEIKSGIAAACAYVYLSSIKGAQAYHIFNPFLYQKCLELFRYLYRSLTFDFPSAQPRGNGKSKSKMIGKKSKKVVEDDIMDVPDNVAEYLDKSEVRKLLENACEAIFVMLKKVSLSTYPDTAVITANLVRDIGRIDCERATHVSCVESIREFRELKRMSDRSFSLMHRLIERRHSFGGQLVFSRIVYPRLAFWNFDLDVVASSSSIPYSFTVWKDLMVQFIEERVVYGIQEELDVIIRVLENLYNRCTDRQDYRSKVAQTVVQVLFVLPEKYRYDFIRRINCFSNQQKISLRNFTIEVVPLLLKNLVLSNRDLNVGNDSTYCLSHENSTLPKEVVLKKSASHIPSENEYNHTHDTINSSTEKVVENCDVHASNKYNREKVEVVSSLYQCIVRYCVDKSSTVRGRAIIQMSYLLSDPLHKDRIIKQAQKILEERPKLFIDKESSCESKEANKTMEETENEAVKTDVKISNLVLYIITKGLEDDKANVRKSSLIAMQAFFDSLNTKEVDTAITLIKVRCLDASLVVRKQAAETLNFLLETCQKFRCELEDAWLKSVLPMVNDSENSVQQLASILISKTIIDPIIGKTDDRVWSLLNRIEQEDNHRRLLVRALFYQHREGDMKDEIINVLLCKKSDPHRSNVIWMLLSDLSTVFEVNLKETLCSWYSLEEGDENNKVRYVAKVLAQSTLQLTGMQKTNLCEDIITKISEYKIDAPHISTVYLCLAKLMDAVGELAKGSRELEQIGKKLLDDGKEQIHHTLLHFNEELILNNGDNMIKKETRLIRVITTIGEVIQFSPQLINLCGKLVEALKTIMASDVINADPNIRVLNSAVPSLNPTPFGSRAPSRMIDFPTHHPTQSQPGASQPSSQVGSVISQDIYGTTTGGALLTSTVRAYAVLAIGKFCLMDEKLAKACIPVFVKQLKINEDHIIRNNIVLVICDLCIRYTLLVDRYSPIIASCLKDRSTLVRHQTLESLTNLIKEQFIRWEGQIMYRFVSTILDENPAIRKYAEFCLKDVLLLQFPTMFYHHFIECLLYFNQVSKKYMPGNGLDVDSNLKFSLSGEKNGEIRMKLYKFMINTFDDKQKFITMAHICEQVLIPIMSGDMHFDDCKVQTLLKDAFEIMSSQEMKLHMDVGKGDDENDEPSPAIMAAAKKIISDVFRKGIIESIMPPLLEMRGYLMERRSPLLKSLFCVLRSICKEHQDQIDEFLAGDKQLKAEIEYDIRRYEIREKAERLAAKRTVKEVSEPLQNSHCPVSVIHQRIEEKQVETSSSKELNYELKEKKKRITTNNCSTNDTQQGCVRYKYKNRSCETTISCLIKKELQEKANDLKQIDAQSNSAVCHQPNDNISHSNGTLSVQKIPKVTKQLDSENIEPVIYSNAVNNSSDSHVVELVKKKFEQHEFVQPQQPINIIRKRTRSNICGRSIADESAIDGRAISTPKKGIVNVTFTDLNLSAISYSSEEGNNQLQRRKSSRIREISRAKNMPDDNR